MEFQQHRFADTRAWITDAVGSALELLDKAQDGQQLQLYIADIVDAFWLIPLHRDERRFFCARLRNKYYMFNRTAQGSRMAPLTFAAVMSLASRWVQSMGEEFRLQVYVDDPLVIMIAPEQQFKRLAVVIAVAWLVMGFPLAFHKATLASKLTWIGVQLEVQTTQVVAEVTAAKVAELTTLLEQVLTSNLTSVKTLRTVIGKCMSVASVIFVWRPFVQQLYTALHATSGSAPQGCVWTKQIQTAARWLLIFLRGEQAGIRRIFTLEAYRKSGPTVVITWDASPYGMGATLQSDGRFVEFFAIRISLQDQRVLDTKAGDCRGQQVWEALAGLIAMRQWASRWQHRHVVLQVRSDNMGALSLFSTLKASSPALGLIAREFALDLGAATCRPQMLMRVPGITNTICDALSRINDPNKTFKLPAQLTGSKAVMPAPRSHAWWRSLPHPRQISPD